MSPLSAVPALRAASDGALREIERHARLVHFPAGAVLRRTGDPPRHALLLLGGAVIARHTDRSGTQVWPARWDGPAIVDKPTLLAEAPAATDLVALRAGTARLLPRERFLALLDGEEPVRAHVLRHLARDVVAGRRRLALTTTRPAVAQVAAFLVGADGSGWQGSQEELARVLGLSRVTVNRALRRLTVAGAVRPARRGVRVADPVVLARFAGD